MEITDNSKAPSPEAAAIRDPWMVMLGFMSFKILNAAHDVGLLSFIDKNPTAKLNEIASALSLPDYSARILLMGSCTIRLLIRDSNGGYSLNPDWAKSMGPFGEGTYASTTLKVFNDILYRSFTDYTAAVRTGKNVGLDWMPGTGSTLYERLGDNPELCDSFDAWLRAQNVDRPYWLDLPALRDAKHVLDAGGGVGTNAVKMVRQHPHLKASVLDLPHVCKNGEAYVASEGLTEKVTFFPGDLAKDPIPRGIDGITLIRMAIFDDDTTQAILRRFWEALPPGGFVFVSSILPNEDETGPIMAMFLCTYHLAVSSGHGRAHTKADYARWFEKAGFSSLTIQNAGIVSGLLARK